MAMHAKQILLQSEGGQGGRKQALVIELQSRGHLLCNLLHLSLVQIVWGLHAMF